MIDFSQLLEKVFLTSRLNGLEDENVTRSTTHRFDQLMHESRALNMALQKYRNQHSAQERQMTEREELLGKQFTANDNSVSVALPFKY